MLTDQHGRTIEYLRLAVTDRCNLRCVYCMPQEGLNWEKRSALLSYEEIMRLLHIFSSLGITKLRFTGGEPFLRKDFMQLLRKTVEANLFEKISITTNGTLTSAWIPELKELGISGINLSADTFNPERFSKLTRRDDLHEVKKTFDLLLKYDIPVRINAVIMEGKNEEDIIELSSLTKSLPVDVRFIEEMPFNGHGLNAPPKWNFRAILDRIISNFGELKPCVDEKSSTSMNYQLDGHLGRVGVIPAFTRSFCGTCNRIRVTPTGSMKTCLYDNGVMSLRDLLRSGMPDNEISTCIQAAVLNRPKDGFEAEAKRKSSPVEESMATIGG